MAQKMQDEKRSVPERVYLTEELAERVLALAEQEGISRSAAIRLQLARAFGLEEPEEGRRYATSARPNPVRKY